MQTSKQASSSDNLPEAIAQMETSTYHPLYVAQKEVVPHNFNTKFRADQQRLTRCPFLLLYGLFIALAAGLVGGFIGRAIFDKHTHGPFPNVDYVPSSNSSTNGTLARILPIPTTGCAPMERKSRSSTSAQLQLQYLTLCSTRWTNAHLTAMSAATPSDCIEACKSYNDHRSMQPCLGAGFVPNWWNQTRAMEAKNEPFNCFLMGQNTSIIPNEMDFEIVALCLSKDACSGVGLPQV